MPSLNSDNNLNVSISTSTDNSGIDQASRGLQNLSQTGAETGKKFTNFSEEFSKGMKTISVVTGVVGAGLSLYAKTSTDYLVNLTKESKALGTQTGMTAVDSSKLIAAFSRMGINADQAGTSFRKLAVDITKQRTNAADTALQHQVLTNKIAATKIEIAQLTATMEKNGDSTGKIATHIQGLQLNMQAYQKQLTDTAGPLDKIGVSTQTATGANKSFNDILLEVSDKFKTMPDGAEKTATAIELFGRSGTELVKVLNLGSDGIKELENNAEKLGLTLTENNIVAVNKYIKSQKELKDTNDALKISVGSLTAPVLTEFNKKLNELALKAVGTQSPIKDLATYVLAFGGPVLGASSAITGFIGNLVAAAPALRGFVGLLANPYVLGIAAAVAVTAGLGFALYKYIDHQNKARDVALSYYQTHEGYGVSSMNLVELATLRTSDATKELKSAEEGLKALNEQQPALSQAVANGRSLLTQRQNELNNAIQQYGPTSDQAYQATMNLQAAQGLLNGQLINSGGNTLNVTVATGRLKDAQWELNDSIENGIRLQGLLAGGLNNGLRVSLWNVEVQAGRTGDTIQGALAGKEGQAYKLNGKIGELQTTSSGVTQRIFGDFLQIQNGVNTTQQSINTLKTPAGGLKVVGRASGGSVRAGQPYAVGDNADGSWNNTTELFVPKESGTIIPANKTRELVGAARGGRDLIITQNIYNQVDYSRGIAEIGFRLSNA